MSSEINTSASDNTQPVVDEVEVSDLPSDAEYVVINSLRDRGYAVVVFTPQELRGAKTRHVEDRMVECGWDVIDILAEDEPAATR